MAGFSKVKCPREACRGQAKQTGRNNDMAYHVCKSCGFKFTSYPKIVVGARLGAEDKIQEVWHGAR